MNRYKMASKKEIFGWAMFDFANQAYTTLIITVIFGVTFTRVIVGDGPTSGWEIFCGVCRCV
jgi:MFS-type transporter involved in bile tolerance (Atg22 family)